MFVCLLGCGTPAPPASTPPSRVTLAVAASARDVVADIAKDFEKETGVRVEIMPGSSAALVRQITHGAPVDVFLCADPSLVDYLQQRQLVAKDRKLLGNRLVVVAPAGSRLQLGGLNDLTQSDVKRLALALEAVPAGKYARQALQRGGVWDQVRDKVIGGDDVRATLAHVEHGADAGIVYATDAAGNPRVRVCFPMAENLHDPIVYPLVLTRHAENSPAARRLYDYLSSAAAAERFRRAGFTIFDASPPALPPKAGLDTRTVEGNVLGLSSADWWALGISLEYAGIAVLLSLPFGVALGWLLARKRFPGKAVVETIVNIPLVLPPVVTGLLLLYLLGPGSWIGGALEKQLGLSIAFTGRAVVLAVAVMGFPLLVRSVRIAFESLDPHLYLAARTLGAGPFDAFFSVVLPLARNGVLAGVILAFARGLGEFGATVMFAGIRPDTTTLAVQVYVLHYQPGDLIAEQQMWRLVLASVVVAFAALAASEYLARRGRRHEPA
jgi:molybdate transport system permease protein